MLGLRHYRGTAIDLFQGDITSFVCDAMVTAASSSLTGGAGVDGAIHQVGGPDILRACQSIGSCRPGEAVVSTAGQLPAAKLIHAVGPIWQGGMSGEALLLHAAISQSLCRAAELNLRHIALPSISTGFGKFPLKEASSIAMLAVREFCQEHNAKLRRISFVLFDAETYKAYQSALFVSFPETEGTDS